MAQDEQPTDDLNKEKEGEAKDLSSILGTWPPIDWTPQSISYTPLESLPIQRDTSDIDELLRQRHKHREDLFGFCKRLAHFSFLLLTVLLIVQVIGKTSIPSVTVFNGGELETIAVAVFGQIIGVIIVIAKALWDEKDFLPLYSKGKKEE